MKIQIDASADQIKKIIQAIGNSADLENIKQQLINALVINDDSQAGELPKEGDNDIIKRDE